MTIRGQFCGFCGSELPPGSSTCPSCGAQQPELPHELDTSPAIEAPVSGSAGGFQTFCGFCGAGIPAAAAHCTECGQAQPELPSMTAQPTLAKPSEATIPRPETPAHIPQPPETTARTFQPAPGEVGRLEPQTAPPRPVQTTRTVVPQRREIPKPTPVAPQVSAARASVPRVAPQGPAGAIDQMIIVRELSVKRGEKTLIQGIDFAVDRGTIVGILGPSGAGKTTLIRVLTTEFPSPPGQVIVGGFDLASQSRSAKQIFGYVPQETQLYEDLTFLQNVLYFGGQYGLDQAYLIERAQRMSAIVELGDKLNDKVDHLSGGQKKRVSVCTALAHDPELVILDEPTSGLDPATRRGLWKFLKSVNQSYGVTMLITTHFLDEAEFCDKLLVINKGRTVAYDSPRRLKQTMPGEGKAIELEMFTLDEYVSAKLSKFESIAKKENVADMVDRSGYRVKIFCKDIPQATAKIPHLLAEVGLGFKAMNIVDTSLEDAFIYLTGEHFREEE